MARKTRLKTMLSDETKDGSNSLNQPPITVIVLDRGAAAPKAEHIPRRGPHRVIHDSQVEAAKGSAVAGSIAEGEWAWTTSHPDKLDAWRSFLSRPHRRRAPRIHGQQAHPQFRHHRA